MQSPVEQRPVDRDFEAYNQVYQRVNNSYILLIAVPLMMFGLMALTWALPFPPIAFLGRYNGYLNWASFLIAALIYYHLRLSPMVSYVLLFMLFGFSYGIIQLEQAEKAGGMQLWLAGLMLATLGIGLQLSIMNAKKAGNLFPLLKKASTWFIVKILKSIKVRY
ncbi:hypothetical protein ACFQ3S_05095 [Mucilaginibacter terrae]|uniref:hypothetical protein n=1 Tax=Mucilaginibacter terrae TaxID=1955052 RepID=UPI00362F1A66